MCRRLLLLACLVLLSRLRPYTIMIRRICMSRFKAVRVCDCIFNRLVSQYLMR